MSESAISHFFKKRTNRSFITYLTDVRIGYASRLLAETTQSVADIAFECGFSNLSNFNRIFKKYKIKLQPITVLEYIKPLLNSKISFISMKTVIIEDKQRIESIILHCDACFVGFTDLEGNPYVVPMNFGYENGILYLHSGPEGSKLEMLEHNNNVCITFSVGHKLVYQHEKVACSYSMRSKAPCAVAK